MRSDSRLLTKPTSFMESVMDTYPRLIDRTSFHILRQYRRNGKSPITTFLFVPSRAWLGQVAAVLEGRPTVPQAQAQLEQWLHTGTVKVGTDDGISGGIPLDELEDDALCDVIYLPPVYLVALVEPAIFSGCHPWSETQVELGRCGR